MPYLNWELYRKLPSDVCGTLPEVSQGKRPSLVHPRRTLDQFYFPALESTTNRDADQTVSKWTGTSVIKADGGDSAAPDSLVVLVGQVWLWVLDGCKSLAYNLPCGFRKSRLLVLLVNKGHVPRCRRCDVPRSYEC
jgi:hypothetical protein